MASQVNAVPGNKAESCVLFHTSNTQDTSTSSILEKTMNSSKLSTVHICHFLLEDIRIPFLEQKRIPGFREVNNLRNDFLNM